MEVAYVYFREPSRVYVRHNDVRSLSFTDRVAQIRIWDDPQDRLDGPYEYDYNLDVIDRVELVTVPDEPA